MRERSSSGPPSPAPIAEAEVAALFAPFRDLMASGAVLAVSGGCDSIGLMHLAARWCALQERAGNPRPPVHVATIDHGLRPGSAEDAAFVVAAAGRLGFPVSSQRWEGEKPTAGLAAAAREARYDLLSRALEQANARVLMTAHTADDQAETVLMRLARGSGVDGLAGMAPVRAFEAVPGASLVRPLLGLEKARIAADLADRGIAWREDPTNADTDYERPRLRQARAALDALGLTPGSLGLAAHRLRRAAQAMDLVALDVAQSGVVRVDPLGLVEIDRVALFRQPDEIALRLLRRAIEIAGGAAAPLSLASLEAVLAEMRADTARAWTLSRAALRMREGLLLVEREPGRAPLPRMPIAPGGEVTWDGRFDITAADHMPADLEIGPLGTEGLALLEARGLRRPKLPARTLRAIPAVWRGDDLVAAPLLDAVLAPSMQLEVRMLLRRRLGNGEGKAPATAQVEARS